MEVTISLDLAGVTTAQQMRAELAAKRQDTREQKRLLVEQQAAALADLNAQLDLFNARIKELDDFIAFKGGRGA